VHNSMLLDELSGTPTIQTTAGLTIDSGNTITVTNNGASVKITGVDTPTTTTDAANKQYVDTQISSEPVTFALDISGMPAPEFATAEAQILDVLEFMYPAAEKQLNTQARILTSSSVGVVSNIDIQGALDKTSITVDFRTIDGPDGGSQNQQLLEDIGFPTSATGIVSLSVTRQKRYFRVANTGAGNFWQAYTPAP
jgi:hypothetical protein